MIIIHYRNFKSWNLSYSFHIYIIFIILKYINFNFLNLNIIKKIKKNKKQQKPINNGWYMINNELWIIYNI
jgi:hypothetical protein